MYLQALLEKLADGQFHSGDELGNALGVSRTAIWKQIKKVEGLGLALESVKGKGYRLRGGLDLLSETMIKKGLSQQASTLITGLDIKGVIDSTNTYAMTKALPGCSGYVCTAEQQIAGRGRRGRQWVSPYGSNIYLSIVWEFIGGVAALEGLSLAVGIAVIDALVQAGVDGARLKWPNDVLHNERKLAGILLEIAGDAAGPCRVVLGIGLNVSMPAESMNVVDQSWVDVNAIVNSKATRNQLLVLLLNEIMPMLYSFEAKGFTAYRDRWIDLDAYAGRNVAINVGQSIVNGKACGVDQSGAVIIDTVSGRQVFNGGEVSLRLDDD